MGRQNKMRFGQIPTPCIRSFIQLEYFVIFCLLFYHSLHKRKVFRLSQVRYNALLYLLILFVKYSKMAKIFFLYIAELWSFPSLGCRLSYYMYVQLTRICSIFAKLFKFRFIFCIFAYVNIVNNADGYVILAHQEYKDETYIILIISLLLCYCFPIDLCYHMKNYLLVKSPNCLSKY